MNSVSSHPALISDEGTLAYAELAERIAETTGRLAAIGVRPQTVVAVLGRSSVATFLLAHAIPQMGAVYVPINGRWRDATIHSALEAAGADLLISERPIEGAKVHALTEVMTGRPQSSVPVAEPSPNRIATILFTSGSEGSPKGVLLTWANHLASAKASIERLRLQPEDRWLACLPLFHVGGLNILYRAALAEATVVLHSGFEAEKVNRSIDHQGVTLASFVPTMLGRVLEDRRGRPFPGQLRGILLGGGSIPPRLVDASPAVLATYGLTEACSHVCLVRPGAGRQERASAGPPLSGIEVRILDRQGAEVAVGEVGTIAVRGPVVMAGYAGDEAATGKALRDGWLLTRDLGRLDRDGNLHPVGRADDAIRSGGETIYPAEIAAALDLPAIAEAVVLGIEDSTWGQSPVAFIVPESAVLTAGEIRKGLEPRLERYKWPRIVFVETIPRLRNGKPDRARLLASYDPSSAESLTESQ